MQHSTSRYRSVSSWLKELFGESVRKITIDAGLGCPNRDGTTGTSGCIYCNPRGSGTGALARGLSVSQQIDKGIAFLSQRFKCRKFIAYFQSFTNTYGCVAHLAELYREALERPEVVGLAVGTRPDCAGEDVLDLLQDLGRERLVWVEYGLQSIHRRTLKLINRGHGPEEFLNATARTRNRGILSVAHIILGLPGESVDDMVQTARAVAEAGAHGVKIHPLYIVRGTALEEMYRAGTYRPMSLEEATKATLTAMAVLPPEMIVHRITSDPHPEELIAPLWMLDRKAVRTHLQHAMDKADFRQGCRFQSDNPGSPVSRGTPDLTSSNAKR